ncbi:hypothetical protein [Streptomyces goshikiensis]|uniref:hypothetical protein n=1 Tax=Streptomyces goshikiensis TaxID=1942 RepID=UPI0037B94D9E
MSNQIVFKGRPVFGGHAVTCPEAKTGYAPKVLRLYVTPAGVLGSCGQQHRLTDDNGRQGPAAECMFPVREVTKEELAALAAPGKTGRVRGKLPTGKPVDAEIISLGAPAAAQAGGGKAAQAFAAASQGGGKGAAPAAPARVPRGDGGAMTAFFGAVAATAGAAGQIAGAAGQVAGSAASTVGSVAGLGKEGIGLARDGVKEAGAFGARRHQRKMRESKAGGSPTPRPKPAPKPSPKPKAGE